MWFKMKPKTLDYGESAPSHFKNEIVLDASAQSVFDLCFAEAESWPKWFAPHLVSAEWTTINHGHNLLYGGVGSERVAVLKDLMAAQQHFFVWDRPGSGGQMNGRLAFTVTKTSKPLVAAMVEDLQLEAIGDNKCRLTWHVHFELRWFVKPAADKIHKQLENLYDNGIQALAKYVKQHADQEKQASE